MSSGSRTARHDAAVDLARFVAALRFDDLTPAVVTAAKKAVLDHFAVALAGGTAPGCGELLGVVRGWGGKAESTIIGQDLRVPSVWAALVNAMMAHSWDYDDTFEVVANRAMHPGVSVIPACLAAAERRGGVSGKEFLAAVVAGVDVVCRLALATRLPDELRFWVYPTLFGYFGGAAGAGKLLGLGEAGMLDAFGVAYSQASGNAQSVLDGALTKRLQSASSASGGLLSAVLAEAGITGSTNTFEGAAGFFRMYLHDRYDRATIVKDLGSKFAISDLSFKPYPCCRYTHSAVDAALQVAADEDLDPAQVEAVTVFVAPAQNGVCQPLDVKRRPRSVVDAQFSIPYTVAVALCRRGVVIEDFSPAAIGDSRILSLAQKVTPVVNETLGAGSDFPGLVEVKLRDGGVVRSKLVRYPSGHPGNPMSMEEIAEKFRRCAARAVRPLRGERVETVIRLAARLDEMTDVAEVVGLVA